MNAAGRPRLLFVSHASGGGVARHIEELAAAIASEAEVWWLRPAGADRLVLRSLRDGESVSAAPRADDEAAVIAFLQGLGIGRVHLHHVHGLPRWILDLPQRLGCPFDVTLHDHFPMCPEYHMTGGDGRFCGGEPGCSRCTERHPAQWDLSIDAWRALFHDTLRKASRVIAPSRDLAARVRRFFPDVAPLVWPHAERDAARPRAVARVLVLGAISPAKGFEVLDACVRDAQARSLPLHFVVIGYLVRPIAQWPNAPLTLMGEYPDERLDEAIALARGDAILFPAQCPESFSYTLSAALASGLPIVATDLGALPERLASHRRARVVRWDSTAAGINDALLEIATPPAPGTAPAEHVSVESYRERYVQPLASEPRAASALPPIPAGWREPIPAKADDWTLASLYEDGVLNGRSEPRERLGRRAALADRHLAENRDLVREKDAEIAALESQLAEARAKLADVAALRAESARAAAQVGEIETRLRQLERSRSWKITAPLRALTRWLSG